MFKSIEFITPKELSSSLCFFNFLKSLMASPEAADYPEVLFLQSTQCQPHVGEHMLDCDSFASSPVLGL